MVKSAIALLETELAELGLPVGEPYIIGPLGILMVGVVGAGGVRVVGVAGELML